MQYMPVHDKGKKFELDRRYLALNYGDDKKDSDD